MNESIRWQLKMLAVLAVLLCLGAVLSHIAPPAAAQFTPPALPRTYGDIATPGVNPVAGNTTVYTKSGTVCALSSTGTETCTGSGGGSSGTAFGPLYGVGTLTGISGGAHVGPGPGWTGATLTTLASGALNFTTTNQATGQHNVEGLSIAYPSTPWRVTMQFIPNFQWEYISNGANAFSGVGVFWTDGTQYVTLGEDGATVRFIIRQMANATTGSANEFVGAALSPYFGAGSGMYFRFFDNGTNRGTCFSFDGTNFTQINSVSRTTFLTPTGIGAFISNASMIIVNWTQDTTASCS